MRTILTFYFNNVRLFVEDNVSANESVKTGDMGISRE